MRRYSLPRVASTAIVVSTQYGVQEAMALFTTTFQGRPRVCVDTDLLTRALLPDQGEPSKVGIGIWTCVTYETKIKTGSPVVLTADGAAYTMDRRAYRTGSLKSFTFRCDYSTLSFSGRNLVSDGG